MFIHYTLPDFLIIGPQRTGTTWLCENLVSNNQIFIPPEKETYFFSNLIKKNSKIPNRLEWYSEKLTPNIWKFFKKNMKKLIITKKISALNWNYKIYSSPFLIGDPTTSYAIMEECLIKEIKILNPNIKIIMLIRHPVDRAWSRAKLKFVYSEKRNINEVDFGEFIAFYTGPYVIRCGMYTGIIKNWRKYIKQENFFIGFFDDIAKKPLELLTTIFHFLSISENKIFINKKIHEIIINQSLVKKEIPDSHKEFLFKLYKEEIKRLNNMFDLNW